MADTGKQKNKGGRPSLYQQVWNNHEGLLRISGWAKDGLSNEQIAENMGIHVSTLYEWQTKYSEFAEALKINKEIVDRHVENALYKRAIGYEYEELTYETNAEGTERLTKRVKKQVAPDTTAQIFWLQNRKPRDWRDRRNGSEDSGGSGKIEEMMDSIRRSTGKV